MFKTCSRQFCEQWRKAPLARRVEAKMAGINPLAPTNLKIKKCLSPKRGDIFYIITD
jgi:hypothetical protein